MSKIYTPSSLKVAIFNSLKEPFYRSDYATQDIMLEGQLIKEPVVYGSVAYFAISDEDNVQLNVKIPKGQSQTLKRGEFIRLLGTTNLNSKPNSIDYDIIFSAHDLLDQRIGLREIEQSNLMSELWSSGYFSRYKPFPNYNQSDYCRVAVVTSANESAHAFADIDGILREIPFYRYELFGVNLGSAEDIARGIYEASDKCDILIITRGGGDLSVFDERIVLESLFKAPCYTISAIGHAKDRVISEMVCDYITRTPTDAARFLAEKYSSHVASQQFNLLEKNNRDLNKAMNELYNVSKQRQDSSDALVNALTKEKRFKTLALLGLGICLAVIINAVIRNGGFSWIVGQ